MAIYDIQIDARLKISKSLARFQLKLPEEFWRNEWN